MKGLKSAGVSSSKSRDMCSADVCERATKEAWIL